MTAADRPAAPELSPAEVKRLEKPEAKESLRERVAVAICAADETIDGAHWTWPEADEPARDVYRQMADAAIRIITTLVEGAPAVVDPAAACEHGEMWRCDRCGFDGPLA